MIRSDPVARSWITATLTGCCLLATACSLVGDESRSCGASNGRETLEAAGLGTEGLTVVEGCTETFRGLREGEVRTMVAMGDEASVDAALRLGSVDEADASSANSEARSGPPSFDVPVTPLGQRWRDGQQLSHWDQVEYEGREWDRYVAWGRRRHADDHLVMIILETGSM